MGQSKIVQILITIFSSTDALSGQYRQSTDRQRAAAFTTPPAAATATNNNNSQRQSYSVNTPTRATSNLSKLSVKPEAETIPNVAQNSKSKSGDSKASKFTRVPPPKYRPHPPLMTQKRLVTSSGQHQTSSFIANQVSIAKISIYLSDKGHKSKREVGREGGNRTKNCSNLQQKRISRGFFT